jgi:hypothetical protein
METAIRSCIQYWSLFRIRWRGVVGPINHLKRKYYASQTNTFDDDQIDVPARRTFISDEQHAKVSAELVAERFGISMNRRAQKTIQVTTQRGVSSAILPITRRYRSDCVFVVKILNGKFATDTSDGKTRLLQSHVGRQLYTHKCGFKAYYSIQKVDGTQVGDTLPQFINDYGVPKHLTFDGAAVQTGPKTRSTEAIWRYKIQYHVSGPWQPNENPAEHAVKKRWYRIMLKTKVLVFSSKDRADLGQIQTFYFIQINRSDPISDATDRKNT